MAPVVHIGRMESGRDSLSNMSNRSANAALLTATTSSSGDGNEGAALLSVSGAPYIEFQINQLFRAGIKRILVEIDTIPGVLLPVADRARANGIDFDFIRSPAELKDKFTDGELLFVMSEGVFLDDRLLTEMLSQQAPFLVTLDGRAENSVYERIDLNSYWAGVALLGQASIEAIAALPEEWSISSSLLRRALQDSVLHRPLKQELVNAKQLWKLRNSDDAKMLSEALLSEKARLADGWVEKFAFAPIVTQITRIIWRYSSGRLVFEILAGLLMLAALLCAFRGLAVSFSASSLVLMLSTYIRNIQQKSVINTKIISFINFGYWFAIALAFLGLMKNIDANLQFSLFPALVMIGLLLHSKQSAKMGWPRLVLCSPALAAILIFFFGLLGVVNFGVMLIVIGQILVLIFGGNGPRFWQRG
jgi:hypothetical protein